MRRAAIFITCAMAVAASTALVAQTESERIGHFQMAYPFPAPDGESLVFQGNFDGRWQLYALRLEDNAIERLSVSEADDTHPAYSPDGRHLAFISNEPGNDEVFILDIETGARRVLAPHPGKDGHPKWSADGDWITFNRTFDPEDREGDTDSAILRVRPDGRDLEIVSDSNRIETFASFSPDGTRVAFVEWFPNDAGERAANGEIVVVDIASGTRWRLTDNDVFDGYPVWGPSGDWIYFTAISRDADGRAMGQVQRISPETGETETVTPVDDLVDIRGIPDRDETRLYYNNGADGRIWIMTAPLPPSRS